MTPERFNDWRVFPRILCLLYAAITWQVVAWFLAIDAPTTEQSAFALTTTASSAAWFKFYVESGPGRKETSNVGTRE